MQRRAASMVSHIDVKFEYLVKVVERDGLITLGRNMQRIESVPVLHVLVGALLDQHLAYLDVAVEGSVVDGREAFVVGLLVHPMLNDLAILVFVAAILYLLLR